MQAVEMEAVAPVSVCFGRRYAASKGSCPQARRDVTEVLPQFGLSGDGAFAGSVCISELFTNALLHHQLGRAELVYVAIHESVENGRRWVGIAVTDAGRGAVRPAAQIAPSREGFGRGLELVRGMGARLTDVRVPGGYTVTAWTPAADELRPRVCRCDCVSVHGSEPSACSWLIEERDGWEQAVRDDDPTAHLCGECLRLLLAAAAAQEAQAASATSTCVPVLTVAGR
jgi:anti-sigma regulatory factor (Ser/Thr protein kinase)